MTRAKTLLVTAALLLITAACSPAAQPAVTWDYYQNAPGGIEVRGGGGPEDMLYAETDAEACAALGDAAFPPGFCESVRTGGGSSPTPTPNAECQSGSAFEIFPPGWATPGNPWIRRCR